MSDPKLPPRVVHLEDLGDDDVIAPGAFDGQDGKTIPIRLGLDGPIIGEGTVEVNGDGSVNLVGQLTTPLEPSDVPALEEYLGDRFTALILPAERRPHA